MVTQETIDKFTPAVERRRIALTLRTEDDLDFYRELYTILKEMPWKIWEQAGFERVTEVRIYPDIMNPQEGMYPVRLRVWIYYGDYKKAELNGFERIDSPWANLAEYWKPYREFLLRQLQLGICRMRDIEDDGESLLLQPTKENNGEAENQRKDKDEENVIPDAALQAKLEEILLLNTDCEENQLRFYIENLNLYPLIISECRRQRATHPRDLRRIMTDVSIIAISQMVAEKENTDPLIVELRDYCAFVKSDAFDSDQEILTKFLLSSPKRIRELHEMADELIPEVRNAEISEVPGLQYLFDRLSMDEIIRREVLCLKTLKLSGLYEIFKGYRYQLELTYRIKQAFWLIIGHAPGADSRAFILKWVFPFAKIDDELWEEFQKAARIYEAHENLPFSSYEVTVTIRPEDEMYIARLPLLDAEKKGKTELEAKEKLERDFEKNHQEWVTMLAVREVFGNRKSEDLSVVNDVMTSDDPG